MIILIKIAIILLVLGSIVGLYFIFKVWSGISKLEANNSNSTSKRTVYRSVSHNNLIRTKQLALLNHSSEIDTFNKLVEYNKLKRLFLSQNLIAYKGRISDKILYTNLQNIRYNSYSNSIDSFFEKQSEKTKINIKANIGNLTKYQLFSFKDKTTSEVPQLKDFAIDERIN